jgi:hypothetical protein
MKANRADVQKTLLVAYQEVHDYITQGWRILSYGPEGVLMALGGLK